MVVHVGLPQPVDTGGKGNRNKHLRVLRVRECGVRDEAGSATKKSLRSGGAEALGIGYARSSLRGSTAPLVSEPFGSVL